MTWTAQTIRDAERRASAIVKGEVQLGVYLLDLVSFIGPKGETVMVWDGGPAVLALPAQPSDIPGERAKIPLLRYPLSRRPDDKRQAKETPHTRGVR